MNIAEEYFKQQKQNPEFIESYNAISEQVDIEWELERIKQYIQKGCEKDLILEELNKLQNFIHNSTFISQSNVVV